MGFIAFVLVVAAVLVAFAHFNNQAAVQSVQMSKVLQEISAGTTNINFVLAEPSLVVSEHEKVVAALPKTILLEPKIVRVRKGSRHQSSTRFMTGYSHGTSGYTSTTKSLEQQTVIDAGMLVATNQRLVFLGGLKTISIDLDRIMGVDAYQDGVGLHCKDKEKVETFRISNDLMLTYKEAQEEISFPFTGPVLERLISRAMAGSNERKPATAA